MGKKFGFSWSWKRAIGFSAFRQGIARKTGVPTTKQGLERKIGASVIKFILGMFLGKR
jgi:hypothetical protein